MLDDTFGENRLSLPSMVAHVDPRHLGVPSVVNRALQASDPSQSSPHCCPSQTCVSRHRCWPGDSSLHRGLLSVSLLLDTLFTVISRGIDRSMVTSPVSVAAVTVSSSCSPNPRIQCPQSLPQRRGCPRCSFHNIRSTGQQLTQSDSVKQSAQQPTFPR